jgi:hypothetical protein
LSQSERLIRAAPFPSLCMDYEKQDKNALTIVDSQSPVFTKAESSRICPRFVLRKKEFNMQSVRSRSPFKETGLFAVVSGAISWWSVPLVQEAEP